MNEQRTQAYLNLINQLLSCNEGDETQVLQENQELLDQDLIDLMIAVAQQFEDTEKRNEAQWLMNMTQQLAQALGLLEDKNIAITDTSQNTLNFLLEVLKRVAENTNPQIIYSFLAKNLDKLDESLITVLDNWGRKTLVSTKSEEAEYIASVISNFSSIIQQFPLGNIALNQEIAITGYQIALAFFTCEAFPQQWAAIQNNLAAAYSNRIRADRAENLERAILAYQKALKVRTFEAFPVDWAMTQNNLSNAYRHRIKGDKSENLERAISAYQKALKVRTFEAFPVDWAMTQNNLANAYLDRIRGDRAENLERAILAYQEALKV